MGGSLNSFSLNKAPLDGLGAGPAAAIDASGATQLVGTDALTTQIQAAADGTTKTTGLLTTMSTAIRLLAAGLLITVGAAALSTT